MELIKSPTGEIITLLHFKCFDGLFERFEYCEKIKIDQGGVIAAVSLEQHGRRYWEALQTNPNGVTYDRPKLGGLTEPEYYLKVLDLARADGQSPIIIKYLIEVYELALLHQEN